MQNVFRQLHLDNLTRTKAPVALVQNANAAELYLYDVISADWGISAVQVIDAIDQAKGSEVLTLYINSPGGDVFEARAIMAALSRFDGKTVAQIDSLCASAATSIALACNEVYMAEGALFMIHNASGAVWGDKTAMRDTADLLQKVELSIITDYTQKTGKTDAEIAALMDAETWMTAQEALANGFIDSVTNPKSKPSNSWNLAAFRNAPAHAPAPSQTQANANRLRLALMT